METRKIGSLEVTVVGLGGNNFGSRLDPDGTRAVVDAGLEAGINFIDTADVYGGTKSEEFLGRALEGRRERVVLATKFGMKIDEKRYGAKPAYVHRACEDSLRRLRTDRIDLYQLHQPDPETPIGDTLAALDELVRAGKVREIGCSNFSADQIREAHELSRYGAACFVSVQNEYSLLHREPEREVLPECERLGLAFIPYFPLASGVLTGKYLRGAPATKGRLSEPGRFRDQFLNDRNRRIAEKLTDFAESRGHTLLELAFSWLLAHRVVASVIAGATKPEQVRSNAQSAGWRLAEEELAEVDRIASDEQDLARAG
ncbi:MAG TPA: aldo/keto reductase [Thermoanaerobaculia bacterium]|jgi:aryl-alcohol dehydrogenase-like predicted oxidoreductase